MSGCALGQTPVGAAVQKQIDCSQAVCTDASFCFTAWTPACTAAYTASNDKKDLRGEGSGLAAPMIKGYFRKLTEIDRAEPPSAREGDSRRGGLPGCCHTPQGFEGSISHV